MHFGRIETAQLNDIDFKLPAEPLFNKEVLSGKRVPAPAVYMGCPKWGQKEWVGKIYPKGTKEKDFPKEYVKHFGTVELNATHYQIYGPETIRKWAAVAAGRNFRFCPKVPRQISHYSALGADAILPTAAFLEGVRALEGQLGPIFMQMSDKFAPGRKSSLFNYLATLPTDLAFFLEVRHPDWFSDPGHSHDLFHTLRNLGMGAVITDTAGRRDCAHMHLPAPRAFIRFVGNSLHPTDYTRIDDWVNRIAYWLEQGLEELYFFLHMPDEAHTPELGVYFADQLNARCGLQLGKPAFVNHNTLF
ncbi:DUF72 domain-containing protein [Chitinophaga lutea]|uniref:DUF72 domain-containing protein n=1 Tax=Chitinophaga lutea TaxID=2488634 RepID=A0A3N4PLZ8_9BACT|nr:DUF72 domain-containing protein [Chitinophaga lutea]RPE08598.1 DUF72 domain-containing protein [Chitinophaga lutea]